MSEVLINVSGVSKAYRIWHSPSARLKSIALHCTKSLLPPLWDRCTTAQARCYHDFYALRDVSFQLRRGEAVGVIGRNGSGKSTLLQIVAGTLPPTAGTVEVNGRVSALLELGSGFNPEFSGRENVFLNASILGISEQETRQRFEEIAAFADIGEFIEQPVKTYSSGMMVRLAFAVSVCIRPDILIVDEALSVGDVFFQQKCFRRIHELLAQGTSLLFVSHDTAAVRNLCDRALLLSKGTAVFEGPPEEAVSRYFAGAGSPPRSITQPGQNASAGDENWSSGDILRGARSQHGSGSLRLVAVRPFDGEGRLTTVVPVGGSFRLRLLVCARAPVLRPVVGIHLFDRMNNVVFAAHSEQAGASLRAFGENEQRVVELRIGLPIQAGDYTFSLGCAELLGDGSESMQHVRYEGLGPLKVCQPSESRLLFHGMVKLPMEVVECT